MQTAKDKPSVLFINRVYPPDQGATGRLLRDLARHFVRAGWNVTVVSAGIRSGNDPDGAVQVVRVKSTRKNVLAYGWLWLRMLMKCMSLPRHDLVVSLTDPPLLVVAGDLVARFKKTSHINWCHDVYPDLLPVLGVKFPRFVIDFMEKLSVNAMRRCAKVIVIGRCMAEILKEKDIKAGKITVVPNWPDAELVAEKIEKTGRDSEVKKTVKGVRPADQILKDTMPKFRILYAGRLGPAHPAETIAETARILDESNPEIEFVFVGDSEQFDWLASERDKYGLKNMRFLPRQPANRLRELMESGDVHLVSMKNEVEGLLVPCKLYAALAVGRPCLLLGPGNAETAMIIKDFGAGSIVPQGESARLAETIRSYRMDSDTWFKAHQGAVEAGGIFTPEKSMDVWLDRAQQVAGKTVVENKQKKAA